MSSWDILKLNAPEWVYITIGSVAAFLQGACFPAFALLFGFTSGVSNFHNLSHYTFISFISQNECFAVFQIFVLTNRDELISLGDMYAGLFVVVAAIAGVSMCLQSSTYTTAGLKMTTRLRELYFNALLSQVREYINSSSMWQTY